MGTVYIATGRGWVYQKQVEKWDSLGRLLPIDSRHQPELGLDAQNNIYLTSFGGRYRTRNKGQWQPLQQLPQFTDSKTIGFVETAGAENFAYVVWEEGTGNPDEGLNEESQIFVGKLYPDGRLIGLGEGK
ncbi:MAG: hypothetical protein HC880_14530 [Bacteroidia bacterium]|nr:hypothetical protein [Bacteroidia bacterium]